MLKRTALFAMACAALTVVALAAVSPAPAGAADAPALKTQKDKLSYVLGVDIARGFQRLKMEFDADLLIKGFRDALSGKKLLLTDEELGATLQAYQADIREKFQQAHKAASENNKREGDAFLAANKAKPGVVTLPSGLQYKILKAGSGKRPTEDDAVECRYRGTLLNGTEFDNSERTGKPATFKVAGVIRGWNEALKLMPVGSKWQLFIPSELAYGARGAGNMIGPNAMLIFEVELLAVK